MKVKKTLIAPELSGIYGKLALDYLSRAEAVSGFYKYKPAITSFEEIINDKSKEKIDRSLLEKVLRQQYRLAGIAVEGKLDKNLSALGKENSFTVCTGHQPNILLGPLYTIYKIVSAIKLAETLSKKFPDNPILPVYYLATEDHDFEELNHAFILGKEVRWELEGEQKKNRQPLGSIGTEGLKPLIDALTTILPGTTFSAELLEFVKEGYNGKRKFGEATRLLIHELFKDKGIIVLDGNDKLLKQKFIPVLEKDIFHNDSLRQVVEATAALQKLGYTTQVHPREINCFYIENESRNRIEGEGENFGLVGTDKTFTESELRDHLKNNTERFSPNVVLRPLYQETILPNLVYIGGPAEVAYWLQYKSMFEHYGVNFPMVLPRSSVLWIDESASGKMQKLGLGVKDLFKERNGIIRGFLEKKQDIVEQNEPLSPDLKIFDQLLDKAERIDPSLKGAVQAEKQKFLKTLQSLDEKFLRALKRKEETTVTQINTLYDKLFPEGKMQERHDNFAGLYSRHGKEFLNVLYEKIDALEMKLVVVEVVE